MLSQNSISFVSTDFIFVLGSQSILEFDLCMQENIELSRAQKITEAIAYSKEIPHFHI